jgi:hypothetical protein
MLGSPVRRSAAPVGVAEYRLAQRTAAPTSFRGGQLAAQLNDDSQPNSALSPALPSLQGPRRPAKWPVDPGALGGPSGLSGQAHNYGTARAGIIEEHT